MVENFLKEEIMLPQLEEIVENEKGEHCWSTLPVMIRDMIERRYINKETADSLKTFCKRRAKTLTGIRTPPGGRYIELEYHFNHEDTGYSIRDVRTDNAHSDETQAISKMDEMFKSEQKKYAI